MSGIEKKLIKLFNITSKEEYDKWIKTIKFRKELYEKGIFSISTYIEGLIKMTNNERFIKIEDEWIKDTITNKTYEYPTQCIDILNEISKDMELRKKLNECDLKELFELQYENKELKKALLFYLDVATAECSSNYRKDMEQWCKILFNCTYDEASKKYKGFKYAQKWELGD